MIAKVWEHEQATLSKGLMVSPHIVELMCVLERTLNVAHTGNIAVIATSLMNPLWVGRSLVTHGTPTFHPCLKMGQTASQGRVTIPPDQWPRHKVTRQPLTCTKRSIIFNYGNQQWEVCSLPLPVPLSMNPSTDLSFPPTPPKCITRVLLIPRKRRMSKDSDLRRFHPFRAIR